METSVRINVEVVYARPDVQRVVALLVPVGTTARAALLQSGLPEMFDDIDAENCPLGVFGRAVDDNYELKLGDRVEVYRPLERDPREARRLLAERGQTVGSGKPDTESG